MSVKYSIECEVVRVSEGKQVGSSYKWEVVPIKGRNIKLRKVKGAELKVGNCFSVLQDDCTLVVSEDKGTTNSSANKGRNILVVGDLQVKYMDHAFYKR